MQASYVVDTSFLEDEITQLAANISAATYDLLLKIARFDESQAWADQGFQSCAHWLNFKVGFDLRTAREKVKIARALPALPKVSEAFAKGRIAYSKVRALARVANAENEETLVLYAESCTASQLEKFVRHFQQADAKPLSEKRSLTMFFDEEGMLVVRGLLLPEEGAMLMKAMDAVTAIPKKGETVDRVSALVEVAERSLSGNGSAEHNSTDDRYQVVLHIEADKAYVDDIALSEGSVDRICCDSSVVVMKHDAAGNVLEVGRKTRRISPAMRRALHTRDKTCVYPGCDHGFVDAHHLKAWEHGGETKLSNLANMCRRHHALLHEGVFRIEGTGGALRFFDRHGREIQATQPGIVGHTGAVDAYGSAAPPCWDGHPIDYHYAVSAFLDRYTTG